MVGLQGSVDKLGHRVDFDVSQSRRRLPNNIANCRRDGLWIGISAHFIGSLRIFPHGIGERSVDAGHSLLTQTVVLGISNDADDHHFGGVAGIGIEHPLADGIGVGEKAVRKSLVNDSRSNLSGGVSRIDFTSHKNRDAKRGEIFRADVIHA